ncbi:MAG TPA: rhomboid family intramembrane serine protease [Thermodesulfobacteriota bacterium]|nr:rhomboid family intramembrane serine protease [Thermodesulfobacteriota bacterium]
MIPIGTNLSRKNIPWATIGLLFANWLIFISLCGNYLPLEFWVRRHFFSTPGDQYPWQLITSMFFHAGFWHLLGNSIYLWVFGIFVEDKLGWKVYLFLYFLTGIASGLIHGMVVGLFMREGIFIPSLGASGAISGIMGIYLYRCYYSKIKLLIMVFFLPIRVQIPAVVILSLWFLRDFIGGIDSIRGIYQNVAFWAHVGGFASGFGASKYLEYEIQARKEKLEFVADTQLNQYVGYDEGLKAAEKLLESDPDDPELNLNLGRVKTRFRTSPEGKDHYQKAIRRFLEKDPEKAVEVFIEYWKKYVTALEAKYQVRLSLLLNKNRHIDLSAHSLQSLINSDQPLDFHMEKAYLSLAKIYREHLNRADLAQYVYEKFLNKFPRSEHREFVERVLRSFPGGTKS